MARDRMRTYLVTGACGGLGAAVTALLAARGAFVFAADADARALKKIPRGERTLPLLMDVTDRGSIRKARETLRQSEAGLDGIVCAAGIYAGGPLIEAADDLLLRALQVNLMGAVRVVNEFFPLLREGRGRILFISSESTRAAMPFTGPYVVSKRALETYAETLRRELGKLGTGVTVIQPGAIRTPLLKSAAASLDREWTLPVYREALRRARKVLGREMETGMEPARVARVIVDALERRRPRRLIRIGNDPLRALLSFLPASWIDALIRRFL
jgi:NAD(P)-dependent dehydrogenase (short-subunit alcohol dehydrogenase family)